MRAKHTLVLKKEVLARLDSDELAGVVGAAAATLESDCPAVLLSKLVAGCQSNLRPCQTHTCP